MTQTPDAATGRPMAPRDLIIIALLLSIALMIFTQMYPDWWKSERRLAIEQASEEASKRLHIIPSR